MLSGPSVRAAFESDEITELVLDATDAGPFDGGCLVCAKALILASDKGTLVRIASDANGGQAEHYGAEINGNVYDASGKYANGAAWLANYKKEVGYKGKPGLRFERGTDAESNQNWNIVDDPRTAKEIAKLLRPYFSRVKGRPLI